MILWGGRVFGLNGRNATPRTPEAGHPTTIRAIVSTHITPPPLHPALHAHENDPTSFVHMAFSSHVSVPSPHSSMSAQLTPLPLHQIDADLEALEAAWAAAIARHPALDRDSFRAHYEQQHVPLALPLLEGLTRYVRNHVVASLAGDSPGFDVLTEEPPRHGNPLLADDIPNLIVTPHSAWASREARQRIVDITARNLSSLV